ncbi:TIGR02444 family protein [Neptunomonas phycophila]|uniref:TIGR02444 family protein n=1 Tax=Neptunomonas phycophila TaxID=1572645 RepID=UPI000948DC89|nr:TIGR02444 family protein [Neptunomonas phycophila]
MQLHTPLWNFVLAVYAQPEVEALCLSLQNDHGLSINRLLFAGWLASEKKELDLDVLAQTHAIRWQSEITAPLRTLRYRVRDDLKLAAAGVYGAMRRAELEAERVELAFLYDASLAWPQQTAKTVKELVTANLMSLLKDTGEAKVNAIKVLEVAFLDTISE